METERIEATFADSPAVPQAPSDVEEEDEGPSPGNERDPSEQEGDQPKRRRRRRGGRRHRRRRDGQSESSAEAGEEPASSDAAPSPAEPQNQQSAPQGEPFPPPERPSPQRVPPAQRPVAVPAPVVRTGSTDKHLIHDEPIAPEPPRRPRTYRDLDAIPDDLD